MVRVSIVGVEDAEEEEVLVVVVEVLDGVRDVVETVDVEVEDDEEALVEDEVLWECVVWVVEEVVEDDGGDAWKIE